MARVIFYQKLGCINNAKQKARLLAAGHEIEQDLSQKKLTLGLV